MSEGTGIRGSNPDNTTAVDPPVTNAETKDAAPGVGDVLGTTTAALNGGERIIALGAILIVADYVMFDVIIDEYFFFTGTLLATLFALVAIWRNHNRPGAEWPVSYAWVLRGLGMTVGVLGAVELLQDLRRGFLDRPADILGALILYTGAFLMFWGARQLRDAAVD